MNTYAIVPVLSVILLIAGCSGSDSSNSSDESPGNNSTNINEEPVVDLAAPAITAHTPGGEVGQGSTTVELSVTTDEDAYCHYSMTSGVAYEDMSSSFAFSGLTTHTDTITGLTDGSSHTYYVRCIDASNNANTADYVINFTVLEALPPLISNGLPLRIQPSGTQSISLQVTTDKDASCRYSTSSRVAYADMAGRFDTTGQMSHTASVSGFSDGNSYVYYVRCIDGGGYANTVDYSIHFSVLSAVAQGTPWAYVGIPYTDWAYNPFTIQPTTPVEWPTAPAQDYYYVEPDHAQATDVVQGGELTGTFGRFGYPDRPRSSIPTNSWISDVFTAGTVVWIKGGTYTESNFHRAWSPQFHGTAEAPVWLYGDPVDKPIFHGSRLQIFNSSHTIFDNLQWIGGNTSNSVLSLTRDRPGATHHITLRNLRFENLNWIGGGGAIVGLTSSTHDGAVLHDIVVYKNIFKNNGGGFDWSTVDNDHHAYKVDGRLDGNHAYRIWMIENRAIKGDVPDPLDGLYKSLSGNLIQVGDQRVTSGGVHHIYAAGNYQEFARQALGWTKRSRDVIYSSNDCTDTHNLAGGNGQCFGHQYEGSYNWWINNVSTNSAAGWMHTSNDSTTGPFYIIGNIFHGNNKSDRDNNWRTCAGASLYTQRGEHYFVNNVFDNSCYGIWAKTNRHRAEDTMHIYNNIFTNFSAVIDTESRAIALEDSNGIEIHMENNLFGSYSGDVSLNSSTYADITDLNSQSWAANNIVGAPLYVNPSNADYNISSGSAAINAGTQTYASGAADVYQQFIDRYSGDINFPGDPADYWPKDYLNRSRVVDGTIDIGAFEMP